MKIGDLIRKERNRQGLSGAELARRAAINPDSLTSAEASTATLETMDRVINAMRCRLTWKDRQIAQPMGDALRDRRRQRGLPQRVVADRVGVSTRTVIALENKGRGRMPVLDAVFRELRIQPKVVPKNRRAVPTRNSPEMDVVYTPRALAGDVVEHFRPTGRILEPCRGDGTFLDAFPADADSRWCEIEEGRDFFDYHHPVDWIISNPPWSEFRAFNIHAMTVATNIVWVIPLVHLSGKARIRDVCNAGFGLREIMLVDTPNGWPQGGFQIAAVHLKRGYNGRALVAALKRADTRRSGKPLT